MAVRTSTITHSPLPRSSGKLIVLMPPMAIRDDVQHLKMLGMIDQLMQISPLSRGQGDYLETLVELVEAYEARRHAINLSDISGLHMLKHLLAEAGLSGSDLGRLLQVHPTMGSKILSGDRKLTWEHAKILGQRFKVTPALFMD